MRKVARRFFESNASSNLAELTDLSDIRAASARLQSEDPA
jgi:hypothetical protein